MDTNAIFMMMCIAGLLAFKLKKIYIKTRIDTSDYEILSIVRYRIAVYGSQDEAVCVWMW